MATNNKSIVYRCEPLLPYAYIKQAFAMKVDQGFMSNGCTVVIPGSDYLKPGDELIANLYIENTGDFFRSFTLDETNVLNGITWNVMKFTGIVYLDSRVELHYTLPTLELCSRTQPYVVAKLS